ncbi:MAG: hypothetical protein DBY25_05740 [Clostridiales bacterium]|nr:MAG: hypothetical protein DBY25_05740 [Clostridiales bacterium]
MNHKKMKAALLGVFLTAALGLSIYTVQTSPSDGQSSESANPFPRPGTESENNSFEPEPYPTVPLSRLAEYYESQLDPDIPKIEVTTHIYGDGFASIQKLPYDAYLRADKEETETDRNKTWFVDLMNNFQSLPVLYDGYVIDTEIPSRLTIRFEQLPTGEIVIKDYGISSVYGIAHEANGMGPEAVGYIHTFEAAQELEFDLWLYDQIRLSSEPPPMRGLRIECEIDGKQVEYDILFQTGYRGIGYVPFYRDDLSHLTPLEG